MKFPIVIDENGDMNFYATTDRAEIQLEAIDVRANEYIGYDAEGRLLSIKAINDYRIKIELGEDDPAHAEELRIKLVNFLNRLGKVVEAHDLSSLVAFCTPYIRN